MDLFGRKSKAALEYERRENRRIEAAYHDVMRAQGNQISELFARLRSKEALAADLFRESTALKTAVADLTRQVEELTPKTNGRKPIHVGDEESELMWQLNNGLISTADYEHLLKELDFQNAEIELDPDYRPRPDLTY